MCAFAGYLTTSPANFSFLSDVVLGKMADAFFRGPYSDGYWMNVLADIGLDHRRLAILDLSTTGAQPMSSLSGRYVIAFNGEIYNHMDCCASLAMTGANIQWRGHSDTETLLAGGGFRSEVQHLQTP